MSNPRYRIQAVSQLTGVPAATLRAWERRYGFPEPHRTETSYRLYSERDISSIKVLKSLCEQGVSPSEAVRSIRAREIQEQVPQPSPKPLRPTQGLEEIEFDETANQSRNQLLSAVRRFDPIALENYVRRAMVLGSAKYIFDSIFAPVLRQVGDEWHEGIISIAQEHIATEIIGNATRDLLRLVQPDQSAKHVLLACVSGELHALPLYGAAFHFIQWGYRVTLLGVNTPPEALSQSVLQLDPDVVGLSVTYPSSLDETKEQIPAYAKAVGDRPLIFGGASAGNLRAEVERVGGLIAMGDPSSLRPLVEVLIQRQTALQA